MFGFKGLNHMEKTRKRPNLPVPYIWKADLPVANIAGNEKEPWFQIYRDTERWGNDTTLMVQNIQTLSKPWWLVFNRDLSESSTSTCPKYSFRWIVSVPPCQTLWKKGRRSESVIISEETAPWNPKNFWFTLSFQPRKKQLMTFHWIESWLFSRDPYDGLL